MYILCRLLHFVVLFGSVLYLDESYACSAFIEIYRNNVFSSGHARLVCLVC